MVDPGSIPPVLPHELVKLSAVDFIQKIRQHVFRLEHCYSSAQIDLIVDEHKALIHAHRCEPVLKDGIDFDALPSPGVNPLEGSPKCSCGKKDSKGRSRLPAL